jgi:Arc/MetJ family transcription regulator
MRTTLDIDDDVLAAAKERARRENTTAGALISRLLREAMTHAPAAREPTASYGFQPFASRGHVVSDDTVRALRDQEGD